MCLFISPISFLKCSRWPRSSLTWCCNWLILSWYWGKFCPLCIGLRSPLLSFSRILPLLLELSISLTLRISWSTFWLSPLSFAFPISAFNLLRALSKSCLLLSTWSGLFSLWFFWWSSAETSPEIEKNEMAIKQFIIAVKRGVNLFFIVRFNSIKMRGVSID